jgi:hypothetical protein
MIRHLDHRRRSFCAGLRPQLLMKRIRTLSQSSPIQQSEIELQLNDSRPDPFGSHRIEHKPHSLLDDNPCSG